MLLYNTFISLFSNKTLSGLKFTKYLSEKQKVKTQIRLLSLKAVWFGSALFAWAFFTVCLSLIHRMLDINRPRGYKTGVHSQTQNKAQWLVVRKQPIIALYFESENVLRFYNLEARLLGFHISKWIFSVIVFNPFYSDGLSHTYWYNKYGIVHFTFWGGCWSKFL